MAKKVDISRWDGNAFYILGMTKRLLEKAGVPRERIKQYLKEATSGDYIDLLATSIEYLEEAGYEVVW